MDEERICQSSLNTALFQTNSKMQQFWN